MTVAEIFIVCFGVLAVAFFVFAIVCLWCKRKAKIKELDKWAKEAANSDHVLPTINKKSIENAEERCNFIVDHCITPLINAGREDYYEIQEVMTSQGGICTARQMEKFIKFPSVFGIRNVEIENGQFDPNRYKVYYKLSPINFVEREYGFWKELRNGGGIGRVKKLFHYITECAVENLYSEEPKKYFQHNPIPGEATEIFNIILKNHPEVLDFFAPYDITLYLIKIYMYCYRDFLYWEKQALNISSRPCSAYYALNMAYPQIYYLGDD